MCCESQVSVLLGRGGPLVLLLLFYFMYLRLYWAALGLCCRLPVFSSCGKWELLSGCGMWASPWSGFSLLSQALGRTRCRGWGLQALRSGSVAAVHGLSCPWYVGSFWTRDRQNTLLHTSQQDPL